MKSRQINEFSVELLNRTHQIEAFCSGVAMIDRYLKERAHQDMARNASLVFVATEAGQNIVRGYYTLSSLGVMLSDLPTATRKKLPKYPQIGATLLGRLGVDRKYSKETRPKPRLGEFLLADAQKRSLEAAKTSVASALLVIDVIDLAPHELATGLKDPLDFYIQYGFIPFDEKPRKLFKPMRTIETESTDPIILLGDLEEGSKEIAKNIQKSIEKSTREL